MDSRYYRPSSPRTSGRLGHPARSSGSFDPYSDSTYYARPASPRTSGDRIATTTHYPQHSTYAPSSSSGSRASSLKYDTYTGRPRRNTLTESDDRLTRPNALPPVTSLPVRSHGGHSNYDSVSSPLARSTFDNRAETYITHAPRREHKKVYSVDDDSLSARLVAEKDIIKSHHGSSGDSRGYVTSGGKSYHKHKPPVLATEFGVDGYSYTDPASMYRDTEPAWRRPRSGSVERGSRPTSMILDRGPRTSNRELGPPPSTRGFAQINNGISRSGSHHRGRSPSLERVRDVPKYDPYPVVEPARSTSTRHHAPAIHQEPRDHRRDTYHDDYDRRDRDTENRRYNPTERFEDRDVATRGFGIASGNSSHIIDPPVERPPVWTAPEVPVPRARPDDYGSQYYSADRAEARMPEPRSAREREAVPAYDDRPRDRERDRRDVGRTSPPSAAPIAAGAAAGAAATIGAAVLKSRGDRGSERDRERDMERDREPRRERERDSERDREPRKDRERDIERDREPRKERDVKDRRDRGPDDRREDRRDRGPEERRDRGPEERRDRVPDERRPSPPEERRERGPDERRVRIPEDPRSRGPEERVPPVAAAAAAAYAAPSEPDRKPRERRYDDEERERRPRKLPSEDSGDERPRHYVDRDAAREADRRKEPPAKEAPLDPDEEYRRRIQQEAERSGRVRDPGDGDREQERRRRREEKERSRDRSDDTRSRGPHSAAAEPPYSRYDDRSVQMLDANMVQEPDSMDREEPSKALQVVAPPKQSPPPPKGILRRPTAKFPEDPEPIREGVAPHKSQMKGKDIPPNARWTKIDRKLVNPQALEEAKERFEERLDCVIVLRVLTKSEIQKLADRTKEIRETREEDFGDQDEDREHRDRDRRNRRSHRDDEDRRGRRDYDDDSDDSGRERERERERDRLRIEDGR